MNGIIEIVGLLLGGGGVGFFLNYLISNRQTDQSEFKLLLQAWKDENNELRMREQRNSEKIEQLTAEIAQLKIRLITISLQAGLPTEDLIREVIPESNIKPRENVEINEN